ncbi:MAG TPA: hypothetical protein VEV86_08055 [Vicinamibacterales bacterium]|jgi:hypothetical protein|nr:hypothetical protein [Vicinamibacterales bacterium]
MAADDAGPAGQLIASRYRIGNRIGEGGMGVVYSAVDEQLRRPAGRAPPDLHDPKQGGIQ